MKKIKGFKKFGAVAAAVCATAGIVGGMSVPAMADSVTGSGDLGVSTPIMKEGGFYKYLLMRDTAQTPAAEMTFEIKAGTAANATAGTNDKWTYNNKDYDTKAKAVAAAEAAGGSESNVTYVPGTDGTPAVKPGVMGTTTPKVNKAVFTDGQTTYDTETTVITGDHLDEDGDDTKDHKYAKSVVTVDFSDVEFTSPGVYRYEIKEKAVTSQANITPDNNTYYLDVYVQNDDTAEGNLKIDGYVFHKSTDITKKTPGGRYANGNEITQGTWYEYTFRGTDARTEKYATEAEAIEAAKKDGRTEAEITAAASTADPIIKKKEGDAAKDSKADGLLNIMNTSDLTVKKEIEGNMADKEQEFAFKVIIDEDGDGDEKGVSNTYEWKVYDTNSKDYMYKGQRFATQAAAVTAAEADGGSATDVKEVDHLVTTTGAGGEIKAPTGNSPSEQDKIDAATITYNLKGGEYIEVTGLPVDATYDVTETKNNDYVLSKIEGADVSDINADDSQATGDMDVDTDIVYTNVKDVITPTGIVTQYLPFFIMAGAGVGVAVFFAVRKKRSEAED